jgi:hypothetical protein
VYTKEGWASDGGTSLLNLCRLAQRMVMPDLVRATMCPVCWCWALLAVCISALTLLGQTALCYYQLQRSAHDSKAWQFNWSLCTICCWPL